MMPSVPARRSGAPSALLVATLLCAGYALLDPMAPDLPAQLARASAVSRGATFWWQGWYGGINTATYSLVSASVMAWVGSAALGIVATVVVCWCGADLVRSAARPRAGALAIAVAACANLWSGRITFAAGMAVALAVLCLLRRGRPGPAIVGALATGLVSPLAAMELGLGLAAIALVDRSQRRPVLLTLAAACVPVLAVSVVFGQPSVMPFSWDIATYATLMCAGVALAPVPRGVRVLAGLAELAVVGAWLVPSPIGSNAARLPMLLAAPLVIATARAWSWRPVALGAACLAAWPAVSLTSDLTIAGQPSAQQAFYAPLLAHLPVAGQSTSRVEVIEPESQGAAYWLSRQVPLARGWERQVDVASNSLFYDGDHDGVTPATYRSWLDAHAVGWVAVPHSTLDFGSTDEAALVAAGLPYLREVWSSADWQLFRVSDPAPVASAPFTVTAMSDTAVSFSAAGPSTGTFHVAYSSVLVARSTSDPTLRGCVEAGREPSDVRVTVPAAGAWIIRAEVRSFSSGC